MGLLDAVVAKLGKWVLGPQASKRWAHEGLEGWTHNVAQAIVQSADESVVWCQREFHEKFIGSDDKIWQVRLEFAAFFLHLVDRIAFSILQADKRPLVMDPIITKTLHAVANWSPPVSKAEEAAAHAAALYNARTRVYASCQLGGPQTGVSGNLVWRAGEIISKQVFDHPGTHMMLTVYLAEEAGKYLRVFAEGFGRIKPFTEVMHLAAPQGNAPEVRKGPELLQSRKSEEMPQPMKQGSGRLASQSTEVPEPFAPKRSSDDAVRRSTGSGTRSGEPKQVLSPIGAIVEIVTCTSCGAKNQVLDPSRQARVRCGRCHNPL